MELLFEFQLWEMLAFFAREVAIFLIDIYRQIQIYSWSTMANSHGIEMDTRTNYLSQGDKCRQEEISLERIRNLIDFAGIAL